MCVCVCMYIYIINNPEHAESDFEPSGSEEVLYMPYIYIYL